VRWALRRSHLPYVSRRKTHRQGEPVSEKPHKRLFSLEMKSESEVVQLCPTLSDPMDCSLPGSSVHGFSRQEYWSRVPLPSQHIVILHNYKLKNTCKFYDMTYLSVKILRKSQENEYKLCGYFTFWNPIN